MSDLRNEVSKTAPIMPPKKPKGKPETSDLDLRKKNDNYNRKNLILWVLSSCLVMIICSASLIIVCNLFFNKHLQAILLEKAVENIVVIVTFTLALFGIQANTNRS